MKKGNLKNWKVLSKEEQKTIQGGCAYIHDCVATWEDDGTGAPINVSCIQGKCYWY